MPIKNNEIVCITHTNKKMIKSDSYHALINMIKNNDGSVTFLPSSGIPLITYVCPICGYIESYHIDINIEYEYIEHIKKYYQNNYYEYILEKYDKYYHALKKGLTIQIFGKKNNKILETHSFNSVDSVISEMIKISNNNITKWKEEQK